ncbi:MAG: gamma carbonic anhydrase family protein [Acidobacteria bacterium]|nr:MAG: gamma carbonic anhydrase family protein [Acidobacteriota bacterium]
MIRAYKDKLPQFDETVFIEDSAQIIGDVVIGSHSSVWFNTTIRGDVCYIRIGKYSNVQDNSVIHVRKDTFPTILDDYVTVGHSVTLHGCHIKSNNLIGIGAILLDDVTVEENCIIAAGALLTPGTKVQPRSLMMGMPAKRVRELSDEEVASIRKYADNYFEYKETYLKMYGRK